MLISTRRNSTVSAGRRKIFPSTAAYSRSARARAVERALGGAAIAAVAGHDEIFQYRQFREDARKLNVRASPRGIFPTAAIPESILCRN